ncbi:MAG: dockerin type I repeat-containing protein [Clostridia bacterium]|nr:dockerin type I repeat-containing protein [Clostridia bacterium]
MHSETKRRTRRLKRHILLMLAACFVLVSILSIGINAESRIVKQSGERSEDYRKWAQGDPRWANLTLGTSGKTVGSKGCLVTSVTKLLIQSGFKNSSSFNVGTYVTWLNSHGGLSSAGNLIWVASAGIANGFDFYGMDFTTGSSSSSSMQNRIMNYIRGGYQIVLNVKNAGHWIAVDNAKSLATGQVYIMDSLNNVSGNADVTLTSRYSYVSRICLFTGHAATAPNPTPNPTQSPAPEYANQCDSESVSVQARVTAQSATLYTQPCASGNGSQASGTVSNGSILDLSAQILNTSGENWYRVERENGQQSYISLQNVEFAGFVNDLRIVAYNPPSGNLPQGSGYSLNEAVVSSHRITSVTGRFVDQNGTVIKSVTLNPNVRGLFNISSSQINSQLRFGELSVGHYAYELIAEVTADSNMTSETKVFTTAFVSPFSIGTNPLSVHTVSFVDGVTGEVVGTQTVAHGFYPVAISAPEHEGLVFSHWIGAGQRVYADTQLTALYVSGSSATGDADGNGTVTVVDALMVLRCSMGTIGEEELILSAADMNGDGQLTVGDAIMVLRVAMM